MKRFVVLGMFLSFALGYAIAPTYPVAVAQEKVNVATPIVKTITTWELDRMCLEPTRGVITVDVISDTGEKTTANYVPGGGPGTRPAGPVLLNQLNNSNNSTVSLITRVYNRLIADGIITGTVSGTPR